MTQEIIAWRRRVQLQNCPIGLFYCSGELCLKTEYGNNEGRIDAYIVSSGEFFWGAQPQSIANQRKQLVTPAALAIETEGGDVKQAPSRSDESAGRKATPKHYRSNPQ